MGNSIKELGLSWNHMSDLKGWNSAANTVYGINAIPHVLLIDPNGTIIAKYLNSEKLTQVLGELINNFIPNYESRRRMICLCRSSSLFYIKKSYSDIKTFDKEYAFT